MPELIKLNEALKGIVDGIEAAIEAERDQESETATLKDIKTVIRGDKSRPTPKPPVVWIRPLTATADHSQRSYAEKWQLNVLLLAIVKNTDPEKGFDQATDLAAKARSAVLKDRTLGNRKYVQDVRSATFEMSGPDLRNEAVTAATATVQVHFVILENNP